MKKERGEEKTNHRPHYTNLWTFLFCSVPRIYGRNKFSVTFDRIQRSPFALFKWCKNKAQVNGKKWRTVSEYIRLFYAYTNVWMLQSCISSVKQSKYHHLMLKRKIAIWINTKAYQFLLEVQWFTWPMCNEQRSNRRKRDAKRERENSISLHWTGVFHAWNSHWIILTVVKPEEKALKKLLVFSIIVYLLEVNSINRFVSFRVGIPNRG